MHPETPPVHESSAAAGGKRFTARYEGPLPQLLEKIGASLAISTYQANALITIGAQEGQLIQNVARFDKPMGVALFENRIALATRQTIQIFSTHPAISAHHRERTGVNAHVYTPRAMLFTGEIDLHDLTFYKNHLLGVATRFSCLSYFDYSHSFVPVWKPGFVTRFEDTDLCHLNGLAMKDGEPRYVTALGATNEPMGWRDTKNNGGVLIEVDRDKVVLDGLSMPHSPRLHRGMLYWLHSATGEVLRAEPGRWEVETLLTLPAFVRGLAIHGRYLFVGASKIRQKRFYDDHPLVNAVIHPGVTVIDVEEREVVARLWYEEDLEEIYDVHLMAGKPHVILSLPSEGGMEWLLTPQHALMGVTKENSEEASG